MPARVTRVLPALLVALVLAVAGCSAGSTTQGSGTGTSGTSGKGGSSTKGSTANTSLTVGFIAEPRSLDFTQDDGAAIPQALLVNVYEGLVKLDEQGRIVPLLASSWKVSADRTVYTFTLRPNVTFTNGAAFTAADAAFSIDRVKTAWKPAVKSGMDVVAKAEPVGEHTLKVTLKRPSNSWLYAMTTRIGAMFSRTGVSDLANKPVGTGPYTLQKWTRGDSIVFVRNKAYWGKKPDVATVTLRYFTSPTSMNDALRSGGLDVISTVQAPDALSQFDDKSKYRIIEGTSNGEVVLAFNDARKPFTDKRVRQAITYALNRKAILDTAWAGRGTLIGSMVPPTDPWYEDLTGVHPYDPAKARALLRAAGHSKLSLNLRIPNLPYAVNSAQVVKSQLADVGVSVSIEPLEFPARWLDEVFTKGDYDMSIIAHVEPRDIVQYANPQYYWHYDSKPFQTLITQADEGTAQQQVTDMRKAARLLADDAASDWLFLLPNLQVTTTRVHGVPKNVLGEAYDLTTLSVS